jgi:hypothetical protein
MIVDNLSGCAGCDDNALGYAMAPIMAYNQLVSMRPSSAPTQSLPAADYTKQIMNSQQQMASLLAQRASLPSIGSSAQQNAINAQIRQLQPQLQQLETRQAIVSAPSVQRAGIESQRLRDEQVALKMTAQPTMVCGTSSTGKSWGTFLSVASSFGVPIPPDAMSKPGTPIYCSPREYAAIQQAMAEANVMRETAKTATATAQQMEVDRLIGGFNYRKPTTAPDYFAAMDSLTSVLTNDLLKKGLEARQAMDSGTARKYVQGAIQNALNGNADRVVMDSLTRDLSDYIDRYGKTPDFNDLSAMVQKYIKKSSPEQLQLQQGTTAVPIYQPPSMYDYGSSPTIVKSEAPVTIKTEPAKAPNWLLPLLAVGGGVALYALS